MEHKYTKKDIDERFSAAVGKTLGEIDTHGDFDRTITNPKITGIAGDVVEHSILRYESDTRQDADIVIDGQKVEVKTTGLRGEYGKPSTYRAKERITITNVSPEKIIHEEFWTSSLWTKLEHTLLAYYLYDSKKVVKAYGYRKFPFIGYQLHEFSDEDQKVIMQDWKIIQDFCLKQDAFSKKDDNQAKAYSLAKKDMMYLETAPGWKNGPRFGLKKSYVDDMIQGHFKKQNENVVEGVSSYADLYELLSKKTKEYSGKTVGEIREILGISNSGKNVAHSIITKILNPNSDLSKDENQFDMIRKSGIVLKIVTLNSKGKKKENCKFNTINFSELTSKSDIKDTDEYEYFLNTHFIFAIFKDGGEKGALDDIFLGFKPISFTEEFLEGNLIPMLSEIKSLITDDRFTIKEVYDKKGQLIINKNGMPMEKTNFPKSKDNTFFVNNTGRDSSYKPLEINGYHTYYQQIWLRGDVLVDMLNEIDYL